MDVCRHTSRVWHELDYMGIQHDSTHVLCSTAHSSEAVTLPLYTDPLSMSHVQRVDVAIVEPMSLSFEDSGFMGLRSRQSDEIS